MWGDIYLFGVTFLTLLVIFTAAASLYLGLKLSTEYVGWVILAILLWFLILPFILLVAIYCKWFEKHSNDRYPNN